MTVLAGQRRNPDIATGNGVALGGQFVADVRITIVPSLAGLKDPQTSGEPSFV
jgi:hypothetical protein